MLVITRYDLFYQNHCYVRTQARNQDFHAGQAKPVLHLWRCASEVARSAAERAAAGVWGRSPQRGLGAEPLVGG